MMGVGCCLVSPKFDRMDMVNHVFYLAQLIIDCDFLFKVDKLLLSHVQL